MYGYLALYIYAYLYMFMYEYVALSTYAYPSTVTKNWKGTDSALHVSKKYIYIHMYIL